ncbi:MAG: c-type cytochrome domain-containing protein, partial [Planctomycetota bacterium]
MLEILVQLVGRTHPLILHLPIGLMAGLVTLELWNLMAHRLQSADQRTPVPRGSVSPVLLWLMIASTLAAAVSGVILAREDTYPLSPVALHRNFGLAFTAILCMIGMLHALGMRRAYLSFLALSAALLVPAGHFGASLTHGESFLYAPLLPDEPESNAVFLVTNESGDPLDHANPTYDTHIQAILAQRCISCHGSEARKGGLSLDSIDNVYRSSTVVPGDSQTSELLARMRLPLDDEKRMPPKSREQPEQHELDLIEAWIQAGASEQGVFEIGESTAIALAALAHNTSAGASQDAETLANQLPDVPQAALDDIDRLSAAFAHVAPISPGQNNLWIDLG